MSNAKPLIRRFMRASRKIPVICNIEATETGIMSIEAVYSIVDLGWEMTFVDRRRARRFQVKWQVRVAGTDPAGLRFVETSTLENISSSGAFLYVKGPLTVGSKLDIMIKVPSKTEKWMKYTGEVVRTEGMPPKLGIGMKFDTFRPTFITR
jgi:hypothetical protein